MRNNIITNSMIYTVGNLLPKIVSFLLLPLITRYLTPQDYGVVTAIGAIIMFLSMTSGLQMNAGFGRCYFDYKDEKLQGELLGTALLSNLLFNSAFIAVCLILQPWLQKLYPAIPFVPYYIIGFFTVPIIMMNDLIQLLFRIQERPAPFVFVSIFRFATNLGFMTLLVFWKQMGALGLLLASLLAALASLPVAWVLARRFVRIVWRKDMFRGLLQIGLQTVPYMLSAAFMTNADRYLVNRLATTEELGLYGVAWKFAMAFGLLANAVIMSYDPHFFKTASHEPVKQARKSLGKISTQIAVFFTLLGSGVAIFSPELIHLMTAPEYAKAALILPWLMLAGTFGVWDGVGSEGAKFRKKMLWFTPIYIGGGLLNIGLDIWWIPKWGSVGAASATMICSFCIMLLRFVCSQKYYPIDLDYRKILGVTGGCIIFLMGSWLLPLSLWGGLVVKALTYGCFALLCAWWMGWETYMPDTKRQGINIVG